MPAFTQPVADALDYIAREKAGFVPPFLSPGELTDLMAAWRRLFDDPTVKLENQRFIVDHKLYREAAFARLATHPVVQQIVRNTIGDFQLAGFSVIATPKNSEKPTTPQTTNFHTDHCVYSDVPVCDARDTFVCVWVNFEDLAMENGPFALAVGTHKLNIGWEFFKSRPGLKVTDMGWDRVAQYNVGPAGSTAVYSGKTWHAGTNNCSNEVRKGLNMNFVPRHPLDTLKRNPFDLCALSEENYAELQRLIGIPGYIIERIPALSAAAAA
jgi:ectoine hydroxylase-related dioxygenase (phytanoyl-CoA dioxygenase family)